MNLMDMVYCCNCVLFVFWEFLLIYSEHWNFFTGKCVILSTSGSKLCYRGFMDDFQRFGFPLSEKEESERCENGIPKTTKDTTKWGIGIYTKWVQERENKDAALESVSSGSCDTTEIQSLATPLEEMSAVSLNFWLCKFIREVRNKHGEFYPQKTLYNLACCFKRKFEIDGRPDMNPMDKNNTSFFVFRNVLDSEMKAVHKQGVVNRKPTKEPVLKEEEEVLWQKGLLGAATAKNLLDTIYFYNGKVFGLRGQEHRLIRVSHFEVGDNFIEYRENVSKTYHGGLKDLKKKGKVVKHICHEPSESGFHDPCLVMYYQMYFRMISGLSKLSSSLYFRPNSQRFAFDDVAVGIHTLNGIVPQLMKKAGLSRKTAHSLRVTCATSLFNAGFDQKLVRDRTGHTSDAVFTYEKTSVDLMGKVSSCLNPPSSGVGGEGSKRKVEEMITSEKKVKIDDLQSNPRVDCGMMFKECSVVFNVYNK